MTRRALIAGFVVTALSWALAVYSTWTAGAGARPTCAHDGVPIKDIYEVTATFAGGALSRFCNVTCASAYLSAARRLPEAIRVVDEDTLQAMDAFSAVYVESDVVTNRESGNRIHVFGAMETAREHAALYRGEIIPCPIPKAGR